MGHAMTIRSTLRLKSCFILWSERDRKCELPGHIKKGPAFTAPTPEVAFIPLLIRHQAVLCEPTFWLVPQHALLRLSEPK